MFYSHVICLGTKIIAYTFYQLSWFYSHVICLGTKMCRIDCVHNRMFYSHVICLGTKIGYERYKGRICFTVT